MRVLCTLKSSIKEELNYKVIHMHYEEYTGKKCELKMKLFLYRFQIKVGREGQASVEKDFEVSPRPYSALFCPSARLRQL